MFYAFIYKMSLTIENNDKNRENIVNNTFKQLLNRLQIRKSSPPRNIHSKMIKQKSEEYEKCRKYSAAFKYRAKKYPSNQLNRYQKSSVSFSNTPANVKQTRYSIVWPKKEAISDRCKTQITIRTLHSKTKRINQYNPMLIAKSFILEQFQPRKTMFNTFMKTPKLQEDKLQQNRMSCLENFRTKKKSKQQQQRMFNFRKNMKKIQNKSYEDSKNNGSSEYQPWETDHTHDVF